jgi:hypothetical protein
MAFYQNSFKMQAQLTSFENNGTECLHCFRNLQQFLHLGGHSIPYFIFRSNKFRRAICKNCKDKDRKVATVHLKVLRTEERHNAHTMHTMCFSGTDIGERKLRE